MDINEKAVCWIESKSEALKDELIVYTYDVCMLMAKSICGDEWEDAAHDAIETIMRTMDKFNPDKAMFSTYIGTCCRNALYSYIRKNKPTHYYEDIPDSQECSGYTAKLYEELSTLIPKKDLEILVAYKSFGYTLEKIGNELGVSKQSVHKRINKALTKVQEHAYVKRDN